MQLIEKFIIVERGQQGFGLYLTYRGPDKYEEKDTGIFVHQLVPGGQAALYGVTENDKIVKINEKRPRNLEDAIGLIKQAGNQIKLFMLREEGVPTNNVDPVIDTSLQSGGHPQGGHGQSHHRRKESLESKAPNYKKKKNQENIKVN